MEVTPLILIIGVVICFTIGFIAALLVDRNE